MTIEELILVDRHKVRRDSNLMSLYIGFFKQTFNYLPSCAGCTFESDWNKLKSYHSKKNSLTPNSKVMSNNITIKKVQGKILAYQKDGKTYRLYDNILTDAFIKEYIANGTDEEKAERKKMFVFPTHKKEDAIVEKAKPKGKKK